MRLLLGRFVEWQVLAGQKAKAEAQFSGQRIIVVTAGQVMFSKCKGKGRPMLPLFSLHFLFFKFEAWNPEVASIFQ